ncbi:MAG: hypothetical protein BMS9Abin04_549 [Planctomycetia bacterium]|nr:MAG: hypothetical protein BMS9Abin04_549 [Planctomycetia bacterium]
MDLPVKTVQFSGLSIFVSTANQRRTELAATHSLFVFLSTIFLSHLMRRKDSTKKELLSYARTVRD